MGGGEQRKGGAPREPVSLVVDYEGVEDLCRDYTENLSSGGTFVHSDRNMSVGDRVDLQLSFPGLLEPLRIAGVVRWVRAVSEVDTGVGIEFIDFDEDARNTLESVLNHIQDRDPTFVQPSLRVLLVEDNPHVARLIREGLGSGRFADTVFDFSGASNGREALDLLHAETFDVLVIDVNLPVVDGPSVIKEIRQLERYRKLPVIAVSAGGQQAADEAMEAGADFFLEKPMRLRQIIKTMQELLGMNL